MINPWINKFSTIVLLYVHKARKNLSTSKVFHFRYGDTLNPWGDLITMARAWCVLKPGGRALIGIPIGPGVDRIYFNSHKLYGPLMLSHLFSNWKQIHSDLNYDTYDDECIPCYQEIFIVEK